MLRCSRSNAIDKQRLLDLQEKKLDQSYRIRISTKDNCLWIEDNGIGMSREDLVKNLSTIAKSGTKEFIKQMQEKGNQIGEFLLP